MKKTVIVVLFVAAIAMVMLTYYGMNSSDSRSEDEIREQPTVAGQKGELGDAPNNSKQEQGDEDVVTTLPYEGLSFADAKVGAERGDPAAQRILAQMYDECFLYNLGAEKHVYSQISRISKEKPQFSERLKKIKERLESFCPTVDGGQPIPVEAVSLWMEQSAKGGDLVARARILSSAMNQPDQKEVTALVRDLAAAKNPEAVFNTDGLIDDAQNAMSGTELAPAFEGKYAAYAWQVAACRAGFDCSQEGSPMRFLCFQSGFCGYSSYDSMIIDQAIPAGARSRFEEQVRFIREHFLEKK